MGAAADRGALAGRGIALGRDEDPAAGARARQRLVLPRAARHRHADGDAEGALSPAAVHGPVRTARAGAGALRPAADRAAHARVAGAAAARVPAAGAG